MAKESGVVALVVGGVKGVHVGEIECLHCHCYEFLLGEGFDVVCIAFHYDLMAAGFAFCNDFLLGAV